MGTREEFKSLKHFFKIMTMHNVLHPNENASKLYIKSKEKGRGLVRIEGCFGSAIKGLEMYTIESKYKEQPNN